MARKTQEHESFEDKLHLLEDLVSQIEDPACPLEKAIDLCSQGMKLYTELSERLSKLERKIYEVKNLKALAEGKDTSPDLELFSSQEDETDSDKSEDDYGF